jgi:hypothetical protein
VKPLHLSEAINYRTLDRRLWSSLDVGDACQSRQSGWDGQCNPGPHDKENHPAIHSSSLIKGASLQVVTYVSGIRATAGQVDNDSAGIDKLKPVCFSRMHYCYDKIVSGTMVISWGYRLEKKRTVHCLVRL